MNQPQYEMMESPKFEWDMGLTVESTCSTIVNGTMYIIGGPPNNATQFMKVTNCTLENLGDLNWPADGCLATTYYRGLDEMGIVCAAGTQGGKTCYKFDPEGGLVLNHYVYKVPSTYNHNMGTIVNWKGSPLLIGGRSTLKVEHLWWTVDYPFTANWTEYQQYPGINHMNGFDTF